MELTDIKNGLEFKVKGLSEVFTLRNVYHDKGICWVEWLGGISIEKTQYNISTVLGFFNDGTWKKLKLNISQ